MLEWPLVPLGPLDANPSSPFWPVSVFKAK